MPEKRKVTVRRTRRAPSGSIPINKHLNDDETIHVVNLKKPLSSVKVVEESITNNYRSVGLESNNNHWSFKLYRKIAVSFIVMVVFILALVAYFAAVKLEIVVTPRVMPLQASSVFEIYDRPENFNLPSSSILGIVREMEVDYSTSYPVSGGEVTGAEVSGKVTLVNNYIKDQPLVATTRLLTNTNQLLRLKETVVVPAGGSVEAEVYGESADPSFALADARLTIPGLWAGLQDKIYAEAKANDVTYKEIKKSIVTQADLDQALVIAKQALLDKAKIDIESVYSTYDQKIYQLNDDSVTFSFDSKVGEEKSNIGITINGQLVITAFRADDLVNLNKTTLESGLDSGQALIEEAAKEPTFKIVSIDTTNNIAQVEMMVDGAAKARTENDLVDREKLVGLTRSQIENYLDSLENIASYELYFSPSFIKIAPQLVDRISIKLK